MQLGSKRGNEGLMCAVGGSFCGWACRQRMATEQTSQALCDTLLRTAKQHECLYSLQYTNTKYRTTPCGRTESPFALGKGNWRLKIISAIFITPFTGVIKPPNPC